jgi:hypothetical protein
MVLAGSTFLPRQHLPMDVRNHRLSIRNFRLGILDHRFSIRNRNPGIRNLLVGIECQLGLNGVS